MMLRTRQLSMWATRHAHETYFSLGEHLGLMNAHIGLMHLAKILLLSV